MNYIEIIGLIATIFILMSMSFKTISRKGDILMRSFNLVGCIIFTVYGFLLPAYSTGILNALLIIINTYHLIIIIKRKDQYNNTEISSKNKEEAKE